MTKINNGSALALASLRRANTKNDIVQILRNMALLLGAKYFQIIPAPNCPMEKIEELIEFGDFSDWHKQIYKSSQSAIVDPCLYKSLNSTIAVRWRKIFALAKGTKEREFINRLRNEGLRDGINFTIHGPNGAVAVLAFAAENPLIISPNDEDFLGLVAILALQRIKQYFANKAIKTKPQIHLTEREKECLSWILDGKTNWEIGALMGISARTVQFHINNCQTKLNAINRVQVATKALIHGLVEPNFPILDSEESVELELKSHPQNHKSNYSNLGLNIGGLGN